jgi:hypothetical protein
MARYVKGQRQPGQGGRRNPPGGRPTKEQVAEKESFRQALERKREEMAEELASAYYDMVLDDPATMRHCVDKVLPTLTEENIIAPPTINFLQFASNQHPAQLPPREIPAPVPILVGNRRGEEAGRQGVASALKFHDFSNGKRRK